MDREEFKVGQIIKHFKRENVTDEESSEYLYLYYGKCRDTETGELFVAYLPLYETACVKGVNFVIRPFDMFYSEVDHDKYPDIKQKYRFEELTQEELNTIMNFTDNEV